MKLEKKYGLLTAIGMVVGIVIGSGVFFKAQSVLDKTGGNVSLGILAWIIGGIVIVSCACTFAVIATKYERVNGLVDYSEAMVGKKYAYFIGWFATTIYYPTLTSVLSWLCARYTGELLGPGWELTSNNVMVLGYVFMIATFALNAVAPKLAGKYQVSTTFIKLIPLILMAVVGIVYGLVKTQVHFEVINGEVVNIIPHLGLVLKIVKSPIGLIIIGGLSIFLLILSYKKEKKEETSEIDSIKEEIERLKKEVKS